MCASMPLDDSVAMMVVSGAFRIRSVNRWMCSNALLRGEPAVKVALASVLAMPGSRADSCVGHAAILRQVASPGRERLRRLERGVQDGPGDSAVGRLKLVEEILDLPCRQLRQDGSNLPFCQAHLSFELFDFMLQEPTHGAPDGGIGQFGGVKLDDELKGDPPRERRRSPVCFDRAGDLVVEPALVVRDGASTHGGLTHPFQ